MLTLTIKKPTHRTLHDKDYINVIKIIDQARQNLSVSNPIRYDTRCPICGGAAWVLPKRENNGQTCIAQCESGCFDCWE